MHEEHHTKAGVPWRRRAVLVDRVTASAAESVLIAFIGQDGARSFGERTYGVPTGNQLVDLSDGAVLVLTGARMLDRRVTGCDSPITPDEVSDTRGTDGDPVLDTATDWLHATC